MVVWFPPKLHLHCISLGSYFDLACKCVFCGDSVDALVHFVIVNVVLCFKYTIWLCSLLFTPNIGWAGIKGVLIPLQGGERGVENSVAKPFTFLPLKYQQ
ncbi:unnamed protein product [Lupinus luteus]|uniref:Uncharacterized protein n=1 Tax=Lupinus luteus TaxID=3873 RepID=A0AAV1W390_LUPLU